MNEGLLVKQVSLVVTDLDNTLYDWVDMWYRPFSAMLDQLVAKSGLPQDTLEAEIQTVFQEHGTSEYAFVIQELPSLISKHPGEDLAVVYQEAIRAYRIARQSSLRLYPGVLDTLRKLKDIGCLVVAFTESMEFYTMTRVKKLGLDGMLDYVYSPPDHSKPTNLTRLYDDEHYRLQYTIHRFIPAGERKPNPKILLDIIGDEGIGTTRERTVYVGDSLMKDISMAQDADVIDVYAKYGSAQDTEAYQLLRRVTHWSKDDVEREKRILAGRTIVPTFVLEQSFDQLLNLFDFGPHSRS